MFGLSLTGDFDFNNVSVMVFTSQPVSNMGDMESMFFSLNNSTATTHFPLMTFGEHLKDAHLHFYSICEPISLV